jgi:hypothetical protein
MKPTLPSFEKLLLNTCYINGSYVCKSDLSWDLILNVFNFKTVTLSDTCTWIIIIHGGAKSAHHYIFLSVIHQPRVSFFPALLSWKRKKYWFKSFIWADQYLNLRWTTFMAIMLTITHVVQMFVVSFFFKYA